jgi:D-3-phosphoglycerate dehydrogenase
MKHDAWLINVGRGGLILTDALVRALKEGWIGGAGLDVTDPEPLPDGHPLWALENCLITPHTANPPQLEQADMEVRIRENVRRRRAGKPLLGLVSSSAGY